MMVMIVVVAMMMEVATGKNALRSSLETNSCSASLD